jgi:PAS domain-containing protein
VARAASQDALLREWVEHHQPEGYEGIQDCSDINDRTEAYLARAASQERPQPDLRAALERVTEATWITDGDNKPICMLCDGRLGSEPDWCEAVKARAALSGVAQERPPIDVDWRRVSVRVGELIWRRANVTPAEAHAIATDIYALLAGGSVASPEPTE